MTTRRNFVGALGTLFAAPSWALLASAEERLRLAVVVAKSSPLAELSLRDLKNVFRGDRLSGPKLIPFAFASGSPERIAFDQAVLGLTPKQVAGYWIDRKIRGQSGPPQTIDNAELLMKVIANLPGSVGYVRASDLKPYVRALLIDGKGVTDEGYAVEA